VIQKKKSKKTSGRNEHKRFVETATPPFLVNNYMIRWFQQITSSVSCGKEWVGGILRAS